jgi:aspartate/methionine/tyrosine aminotransferase
MLPPLDYLRWARRFYGQVRFDLATSGLATISAAELCSLGGDGPKALPSPDDGAQSARLQDAVARRYGVDPSSVVPCLGVSGGLFMTLAALFEKGDEIVIGNPRYEPLQAVPRGLGLTVRSFARSAAERLALVPERVLESVGPATRAVLISNPHNPSGDFTDDATLASLAAALDARGVKLLVDEVYREFVAPGTTVQKLGPNVRTTSSLTKAFGVGWARAGWTLLDPSEVEAAEGVLAHVCGAMPPWQAGLASFALDHASALETRRRTLQAGKRSLVEAFATQHEQRLAWSEPSTGMPFGFFVDRTGVDTFAAIERCAAEEQVLVAPGRFFGYPAGFRLSFTAPPDAVEEGLARLSRALGLA